MGKEKEEKENDLDNISNDANNRYVETYNNLLREITLHEYQAYQSAYTSLNLNSELSDYDISDTKTMDLLEEENMSIRNLRDRLPVHKEIRKKSETYEKIANTINKRPTKLTTLKNIKQVQDEINAMKIENRNLDSKLLLKS